MKIIVTLTALSITLGALAETALMSVNFADSNVNTAPDTQKTAKGEILTAPTTVSATAEEPVTVVGDIANLDGKYLKIVSDGNRNRKPEIFFDNGANMVTSGTVVISWTSMIESCTPPAKGAETALTVKLIGNAGVPLLFVMYGVQNDQGGFISLLGGDRPNVKWQVGQPDRFVVAVNLDNSTYSLTVNDTEVAKDAKLSHKNRSFRGISVTDGASVGGQDGKFTAIFGNLKAEAR